MNIYVCIYKIYIKNGGKGGSFFTKIFCGGEKNRKKSNPSENFVKKLPPFPLLHKIYTLRGLFRNNIYV
jgi:hypothetical protein